MKLNKFFARTSAAATALMLAGAASANTVTGNADDAFTNFAETVTNWAKGPLGVGLSITMMLVGAGMGIARNSPMPALSGVAGAAFLNWGPQIATKIITGGALI